eukprot:SM000131S26713  [mRNA]  locus=s131:113579:116664:- [translate_table: standard]
MAQVGRTVELKRTTPAPPRRPTRQEKRRMRPSGGSEPRIHSARRAPSPRCPAGCCCSQQLSTPPRPPPPPTPGLWGSLSTPPPPPSPQRPPPPPRQAPAPVSISGGGAASHARDLAGGHAAYRAQLELELALAATGQPAPSGGGSGCSRAAEAEAAPALRLLLPGHAALGEPARGYGPAADETDRSLRPGEPVYEAQPDVDLAAVWVAVANCMTSKTTRQLLLTRGKLVELSGTTGKRPHCTPLTAGCPCDHVDFDRTFCPVVEFGHKTYKERGEGLARSTRKGNLRAAFQSVGHSVDDIVVRLAVAAVATPAPSRLKAAAKVQDNTVAETSVRTAAVNAGNSTRDVLLNPAQVSDTEWDQGSSYCGNGGSRDSSRQGEPSIGGSHTDAQQPHTSPAASLLALYHQDNVVHSKEGINVVASLDTAGRARRNATLSADAVQDRQCTVQLPRDEVCEMMPVQGPESRVLSAPLEDRVSSEPPHPVAVRRISCREAAESLAKALGGFHVKYQFNPAGINASSSNEREEGFAYVRNC